MFRKYLTKYLLLWLTLTCILAFYWKQISVVQNLRDPFLLSKGFMQGLICTTMLIIGSLLPIEEIKQIFRRWPKVIGGTAAQFLTMPLLAFIVAKLFHFSGPLYVGIILVGCVPGAMASNLLTMIGRGNVSYSVGLTTSSTFFSPIMVPLLLWIFLRQQIPIDFLEMARTLILTVVLPVAVGFTLSRVSALWKKGADFAGESIGNIVIIWIIASVVAGNRNSFNASVIQLIAPLLILNIGGYCGGWIGGKLLRIDFRMSRALMIEVGMQNAGLGAFLAKKYFGETPETALCCALYTFGCMFTGILLVQGFRTIDAFKQKKESLQETKE